METKILLELGSDLPLPIKVQVPSPSGHSPKCNCIGVPRALASAVRFSGAREQLLLSGVLLQMLPGSAECAELPARAQASSLVLLAGSQAALPIPTPLWLAVLLLVSSR